MKTVFMGGKQAGCIGLLTLCATGHRPEAVVAYGSTIRDLAAALHIWRSSTLLDAGLVR